MLDAVQHLAQLEAFDPALFLAALAEEVAPAGGTLADLGAHLDGARGLFAEIDRFAEKSMRIRLLQSTDGLPTQIRTLLYSTVVSYEREPGLLRTRVASITARLGSGGSTLTDQVMQAAERVLAARAVLRQGVVELARRIAATGLPEARRAARDRSLPDDERERWGRARVDLEQLAARGERLDAGTFVERLAQVTPSVAVDAPATVGETGEPEDPIAKRFSLLELD